MSLTYAIGDIHGCLDKLRSLLLRCEMHADGRPMSFVFVGDYIDRGPQSCAVVDCLIDLKAQHGEGVVTLMGNHEAMALAAIDGTEPDAAVVCARRAGDARELRRRRAERAAAARMSIGCARCP